MRAILLILCASLLTACDTPKAEHEPIIRPIAWMKVQTAELTQVRRLSGTIAPVEATSLSFEVGGKVDSVEVLLGQKVSKGQQLAKLNQQAFNLSLQSAKAQAEQAKATLTEARNEYNRYAELVSQGVVSKSGFDNAKAMFDSSQSAYEVAQAQLDIARKNARDSILSAPYDGMITKRLVEPSQQVAPGQAVFEIEGEDGLEVQVMVPETIIRDLRKGTSLPVHFPVLPKLEIQGVITEVGSRAESANAFPVVVRLNENLASLRAGMTAEVDFSVDGVGITGHRGNSLKVPVSALGAGAGEETYVFIYDPEQQKVFKQQVQTENLQDNQVYISKGLQAGDIIATAGIAFLRDGQQVTLLDNSIQQFN